MLERQSQRRSVSRGQTLALALAAGSAAAALAYFGLTRQARAGQTSAAMLPVVTAAQVLPPRQLLAPSLLRLTYLPAAEAPSGAFHQIASLSGRVTRAAINAGEPITSALVTTRQQAVGMAPQIAPFLRAVSIPLDAAGGASGFLEAGDHVDVFAAVASGGSQPAARLIVANARLLTLTAHAASDGGTNAPATGAVLEVTPDAAEALASATGHLTLALRGLGDDGATKLTPLRIAAAPKPSVAPQAPVPPAPIPPPASLLKASPAPAHPPVTARSLITVFRGTQKTTVSVGE